eukprot:3254527-Prymnesium_polylepis.2
MQTWAAAPHCAVHSCFGCSSRQHPRAIVAALRNYPAASAVLSRRHNASPSPRSACTNEAVYPLLRGRGCSKRRAMRGRAPLRTAG